MSVYSVFPPATYSMKPRILFLAAALMLAALPAQAQRELQESVAAAYEARAQAWSLQAEALESDAAAYEARAQAWDQNIIATMAWSDVGEVDSAFVSDAGKAASRARELASQARETASRARGFFALVAWENASDARKVVSQAREAGSKARQFASQARDKASDARQFASVARDAALDAAETASRAENKMLEAQGNATGGVAALWDRAAEAAGAERTMWIRAEAAHDAVNESFDAAREAWNAEAAAWDRVSVWIQAEARIRAEARAQARIRPEASRSRERASWAWEFGYQYSFGRFNFFGDIPGYFPVGIALTLETRPQNKSLSFFMPITFHYIETLPAEMRLNDFIDWYTVTLIGVGARYYLFNGIYISAAAGGEMSGNEAETLAGRLGNNNLANKFGFALEGNLGWKIPVGSIAALDLSFGVRERMLYDYPSRGFRAGFGFMIGNYRDR